MKNKLPVNHLSFFAGGGEMGELTRLKNWSKTSVGKPEFWPQSLRTTLGILLNSKFPMFLFWGSDLLCFYNDAYRPSLGQHGKHPDILGMPGEQAWPEIWHIIKPLIGQVMNGGEATWSEDQLIPIYRNDKLENVYWTFSYSPGFDESDRVAGVVVTCTETTNKVLNINQLAGSRDELQFAIEAAELGTFDYNPLSNKFSANQRLKELFGLPPGEMIDLGIGMNVIAVKDRQRVTAAMETALDFSSGGRYDIEYNIIHPVTKQEKSVRGKGKVSFNEDKIAYRFNGTLQDITEHITARKNLEASEKKFQAAVAAVEGIVWTNNADGKMEGVQKGWAELTGQSYSEYQGYGWASAVHPDDAQATVDAWNEAVAERKTFIFEHRVKLKDGYYGSFSIRAIPILNEDDKIKEWVGVHTDITERSIAENKVKESEERFRNMAEGTDVLIAVADESGNAVYFNKAWVELLGRPINELIKFGWVDLLHADDKESFLDLYLDAFKKQTAFIDELRLLDKAGAYRWLLVKGSPRFTPDGSFAGFISSSFDITDRKKAEELAKESLDSQLKAIDKLEKNEAKLNVVIDASELGIFELNLQNDEIECSPRLSEIFGHESTDRMLHRQLLEQLHPDDVEIRNEAHNRALEQEKMQYESRIIWHDNSLHWIEVKGKIFFNENREPALLIGTCRDITVERKHQQVLEENEVKLNLILDASELGTWEVNVKTKRVIGSKRFHEITGLTPAPNLSLTDTIMIIHPDDLNLRSSSFKKAFETGALPFNGRILWKDNSVHWVEIKGTVFYDEEDQPDTIIGTIADITDDKLQQKTLEDSEKKFRLLANSMPQHVWTSDPAGSMNYYNESVYKYTGLTPAHLSEDGWIQVVHPDERAGNIEAWQHAITTGNDFLFEHRFRRHDGVYRWQLSMAIAQKDEAGNTQMWVGTSTDIEDQKTLANELELLVQERTGELEEKNIELERMNKELQAFNYISSHDLQEPLRKIQTFAARLHDKEFNCLSETGKELFKRMQSAAERMQELINDLLAYSRTSNEEKNYELVNLSELISEVAIDLKEELEHKNAVIQTGEMHELKIIRFQFRQLLYNLISNSIKFAVAGRVPQISINTKVADSASFKHPKLSGNTFYCHIAVTDNGVGFEKQYSEKIFGLFQRLHTKTEYDGTGIGLAIVKKIVDNHNGFIDADSVIGTGSTFNIYIPVG